MDLKKLNELCDSFNAHANWYVFAFAIVGILVGDMIGYTSSLARMVCGAIGVLALAMYVSALTLLCVAKNRSS